MSVKILKGDCREVMAQMDEASVDSIVTDPPYGLSFMGKDWDHGIPGEHFWREALRVAKPGAHLLAFGGTRTFHRLAVALEDAGWEIRDCVMWVYGSGFPKSLDVSKAIDKRVDWSGLQSLQGKVREKRKALGISQSEAARRIGLIGPYESLGGGGFMWFETGMRVPTREQYARLKAEMQLDDECDEAFEAAEREVIGKHIGSTPGFTGKRFSAIDKNITAPATDAARQWQGWGTALKPAWEPIIVARKPLAGTVAANVLQHGTGALNIDACRIGTEVETWPQSRSYAAGQMQPGGKGATQSTGAMPTGRWPANLIHDGSEEVVELFPSEAGAFAPVRGTEPSRPAKNTYGEYARGGGVFHGDNGSAARFFYTAKASRFDRNDGLDGHAKKPLNWSSGTQSPGTFQSPNTDRSSANHHPTVKPTDLMRYLCRLVTPKGGTVLDPFMGSGSTLKAAEIEGFSAIGIDINAEYCEIARKRIASDAPLFAEVA